MSAPTTDIEIMSTAAVLLGKKAFTTIDDADEFAVSMQKFFDLLVASELAKNVWQFARTFAQLSQVAAYDPDFAEYSTAYDLPADMLAVIRLYPNINYQIYGTRLLTASSGELKMAYNYIVPVSKWSAPFKEYMVYSLASKMAMSVTENANLIGMMKMERESARAIAMYVDSQNSPNVPIQSAPWIEVRTRGSTGGHW